MATYITLVNELLRRLNEVPLDSSGQGFTTTRNVQALAKDAINNSIRLILQDGQEWPFLKTTYTQTLTSGVRTYNFPTNLSTVDWDSFYLKKDTTIDNSPKALNVISYNDYVKNYRVKDDSTGTGIGAPELIYQTQTSSFGVTPIPNNAYKIEYVYFSFPSDLTNYADETVIPDRFKHVIIDGAMMFVMRFRSNEQSAGVHQQNFTNGIKAMRRLLLDDNLYLRSTVINRGGIQQVF